MNLEKNIWQNSKAISVKGEITVEAREGGGGGHATVKRENLSMFYLFLYLFKNFNGDVES